MNAIKNGIIKKLISVFIVLMTLCSFMSITAFAQNYEPLNIPFPDVINQITGEAPTEKADFQFKLTADNASFPMPSGSSNGEKVITISGSGNKSFGTVSYTVPGKYYYTITQIDKKEKGYIYDGSTYTVDLDIIEEEDELIPSFIIKKGGAKFDNFAFSNAYTKTDISPATVSPAVKKVISGDKPTTDSVFTFNIEKDPSFATTAVYPVLPATTAKILGEGSTVFSSIGFTSEGHYRYVITEQKGTAKGYTYDDTEYYMDVVVTKSGTVLSAKTTYSCKTRPSKTSAIFNNIYSNPGISYGKLVVKKTVTGTLGDKTKNFSFVIAFSDKGSYQYTGSHEGIIDSGSAVLLKNGESITVCDIPVGVTYTVTEKEANKDGYVTTAKNASGKISKDTITAEFINNKEATNNPLYGTLTISKTVSGELGNRTKYFTFRVSFDKNGTYTYAGSKSGVIKDGDSIRLKHGESIVIENIPVGTKYSVTEVEANSDGYSTRSTGSKGTITSSGARADFINSKGSVPLTADWMNTGKYFIGLIVSVVLLTVFVIIGKRKEKNQNNFGNDAI